MTYEIKLTVRVTADVSMTEATTIVEKALTATKQVYVLTIDKAIRATNQ